MLRMRGREIRNVYVCESDDHRILEMIACSKFPDASWAAPKKGGREGGEMRLAIMGRFLGHHPVSSISRETKKQNTEFCVYVSLVQKWPLTC